MRSFILFGACLIVVHINSSAQLSEQSVNVFIWMFIIGLFLDGTEWLATVFK